MNRFHPRPHARRRATTTLAALLVLMPALAAAQLGPIDGAPLIDGLGGPIGLGEPHDGVSPIDLTPIAPDGLTFYGQTFDALYVNWRGSITFERPAPGLPHGGRFPRTIREAGPLRAIGVHDHHVERDEVDGGMMYVAVDPAGGRLVATWHAIPDRRADAGGEVQSASWQVVLTAGDGPETYSVELRYHRCGWIDGEDAWVQVGFDGAQGAQGPGWWWVGGWFKAGQLLCGLSNDREAGVFRFPVAGGVPGGCGIDRAPPPGEDRCAFSGHRPGNGCSPACYVEPDVDGDHRLEAPHPDSVDPLGDYDTCSDADDPLCQTDDDGDGAPLLTDNCLGLANPDQHNYDDDRWGDACDPDADGDGVPEQADPDDPEALVDNCPMLHNRRVRDRDEPGAIEVQPDADGDGIGDACDDDDDDDGVLDCGADGICPRHANGIDDDGDLRVDEDLECSRADQPCDWGHRDLFDNDADGFVDERDERLLGRDDPALAAPPYPGFDGEDNCPRVPNPDQGDRNGNGIGDACDPDIDDDGVVEGDNCMFVPNPDQADLDGDGQGDECDDDADGDGRYDRFENCPRHFNPSQADQDGDGLGDACDDDADGDGEIDFRGCQTQPGATGGGWPRALIALLLLILGFSRRAAQGSGQ